MSGLIGNFNSTYTAQSNILTNRPKRITVLVEDEYDIPFWRHLLTENSTGLTFEITPYAQTLNPGEEYTKGKRNVLKLHSNFGSNLITCVDSDYDHLLDNLTDESRIINSSDFVLQTYSYSVENYNCYAPSLNEVCSNASHTSVNYPFEDLFNQYSQIVYPFFVWTLLLESKEQGQQRTLPRKKAIKLMLHDSSIEKIGKEQFLKNIETTVVNKVQELENQFDQYINEVEQLKIDLAIKGLTTENAYLFLRGHNIQDFAINNILNPLKLESYKNHLAQIKSARGKEDVKDNNKNHFEGLQQDIERLIRLNFSFKSCHLFQDFLKPKIDYLVAHLDTFAV